jgi:hypothetical protein
MHKFLTSGRRRYALLLFVVGAGSLAIMGAQCQPTKPAAPTGLSIAPTEKVFDATDTGGTSTPQEFVVTNNGAEQSGTLAVALAGANSTQFVTSADTCTGTKLDADGGACTVSAAFKPTVIGPLSTSLVANSDAPADGEATAALSGLGNAP